MAVNRVLRDAALCGSDMTQQFFIKLNRRIGEASCAICAKSSELEIGPELFNFVGERICLDCGRNAAPELASLLELAQAAEHHFSVMIESADRFTPEDLEESSPTTAVIQAAGAAKAE
jgi:hypothetical protein